MRPKEARHVKLVVSLITGDEKLFSQVLEKLVERYGPIGFLSELMDFGFTAYYEREFGKNLVRKMVSFEQLIPQDRLSDVKLFTNKIEEEFQNEKGGRRINIDPGFIALERFVLASCKNFSHRIYLRGGVYADLTFIYTKGDFRPLPWTYPDYGDKKIKSILIQIRQRYAYQLSR